MGKEAIIMAALEAVKLIIRGALALAKTNGISEAEFNKAFAEEKAKFLVNNPDNLPDV